MVERVVRQYGVLPRTKSGGHGTGSFARHGCWSSRCWPVWGNIGIGLPKFLFMGQKVAANDRWRSLTFLKENTTAAWKLRQIRRDGAFGVWECDAILPVPEFDCCTVAAEVVGCQKRVCHVVISIHVWQDESVPVSSKRIKRGQFQRSHE